VMRLTLRRGLDMEVACQIELAFIISMNYYRRNPENLHH